MGTEADNDTEGYRRPRRRLGCWVLLVLALVLAVAAALAWISRVRIADNIIADELARRGIAATYEVEAIGGRHQVLRNIVVGDPKRPDLTVERAEVDIGYGFGFPRVASLRLVRPRLFGTYIDGQASFGQLDPLIFTKEAAPFQFPDIDLRIDDGRGLIEGDFGPVALKVDGHGNLRNGFGAELGGVAPRLPIAGCDPVGATIYGNLSIDDQRPAFEGPVRLGKTACPAGSLAFSGGHFQVKARSDSKLAAYDGVVGLDIRPVTYSGIRTSAIKGSSRFSWRDGNLTAGYELAALGVDTDLASAGRVELDGSLRTRRDFNRIEIETQVNGAGLQLGNSLDASLADAAVSTQSTLLGPVIAQIRRRLAYEGGDARLTADLTARQTDGRLSVVAPQVRLRGRSGATLLAISRFELGQSGGSAPLVSGNFSTGGEGLPRLVGRMEQGAGGNIQLNLTMAEYAAGSSRLAVPEMIVSQGNSGALAFAGEVRASGALPGGGAENLLLPVSGNWNSTAGLALWQSCTDVRFDRLRMANLSFGRHRVTLCPPRGAPILGVDRRGLRVAAGTPSLHLAGHLGETPIAIRSGAVGVAYPGAISVRQMLVTLGPPATASTFAVSDLSAQVGRDVTGKFAGADIRLGAVPLDITGAHGTWRYDNGELAVSDGAFTLVDRTQPARFEPLTAEGASLSLVNNQITANARLRAVRTGREVTLARISHDLAKGRGHANLSVEGLAFDEGFQPVDLTYLAEGVVALARGTVTGSGRIDWDANGVTSSGQFSSNSLDFAAAFGPVKGVSGTIVFSDLLGLTTAPNQSLRVASINPGIEINDGEILFSLNRGEVLSLQGGTWPFMGGTLRMQPVDIRFGVPEVRRYVLEIEGLDAGRFVERMELNNMSATGTFDGTVPLIFDAAGSGTVEGGLLTSRSPGGNVSYIGDLTYEDLGAIANFAFDALRSLDYRQMTIQMNGSLTGEIITRVRLDGVRQGPGAEKSLITKAIADLPIRVDVNIRAPFYQLIGTTRALYDPAAIRDPRSLGLIDEKGNALSNQTDGTLPAPSGPVDNTLNESAIQRRESEEMP